MRHNTLKLLAFTGAIALGFGISSTSFAETAAVPAVLTTNNAISVVLGDTLDFGTWTLTHGGGGAPDDITLVMDPLLGTVTPTVPAASNGVEITAGLQAGSIVVTTPAAATLNIFGSVTNLMTPSDAGLLLGAATYSYAGGATTVLPAATGTETVAATGGADTVRVGGTVTVSGTPADLGHPGEITVTFTY